MLGEDARKAFSLYVREGSIGSLNNDSNSIIESDVFENQSLIANII